jgi:hypothetical protein
MVYLRPQVEVAGSALMKKCGTAFKKKKDSPK